MRLTNRLTDRYSSLSISDFLVLVPFLLPLSAFAKLPAPFDTAPVTTDLLGGPSADREGTGFFQRPSRGFTRLEYWIGTGTDAGVSVGASLVLDFRSPFADGPGDDFAVLTNVDNWGPLAETVEFEFFYQGMALTKFETSVSPGTLHTFEIPGEGLVADRIVITNTTEDPPGVSDEATVGFLDAGVAHRPVGQVFGAVDFPFGAASFADRVVQYDPEYGGGPVPDVTQQDSRQILGVPEHGEMSLGNGGQIVVEFLDNKLTGSGDSRPDLFVFEVGEPETMLVEIKKNSGPWISVGTATGYASGIDIDAYGFGPGDRFKAVRLTDDGDSYAGGLTPGADIVAVGARSTIRSYSEESWLTYWIQAHIGGRSQLVIRGHEVWWEHLKGTAPGQARAYHSLGAESNSPTIFDSSQGPNIEWVPSHWPEPLGNGTHPVSGAHFNALTPVFPKREWCWNIKKRLGVGNVSISQQPTQRNAYTLKIMFNDLGSGDKDHLSGSGFYSIELKTTGRGC